MRSDNVQQMAGFLSDGTSRFTCNGQVVKHNMGCSTFAEYTVVNETNVSKIDPTAPLDKVCLIGCAIATGYGAALNTAKVRPGSTVAIWGLGGVGLAAAMGAKKAGAARIIGVDINPAKAEIGKMFGITEFVNPKDHEEPIEKVLVKMTNGGVDHALECCGIASCMKAAFAACKGGGGVLTLIGLAPLSEDVPFNAYQFIAGKSVNGTYFGGWKSRDQVPKLVEDYLSKELMVDELITHTLPIESINDAVDLMKKGDCVRSIVKF
uniref:Alcohol dehydrogenase class n=1 Tax=Daphnia magna TaxID=35525 RepID=A0A0P5RR22_9CRUS